MLNDLHEIVVRLTPTIWHKESTTVMVEIRLDDKKWHYSRSIPNDIFESVFDRFMRQAKEEILLAIKEQK